MALWRGIAWFVTEMDWFFGPSIVRGKLYELFIAIDWEIIRFVALKALRQDA